VRYYWAKPLMLVRAEISYLRAQRKTLQSEKQELIKEKTVHEEEKKECWQEKQKMKAQRSNDDYRWRSLNNNLNEHTDAIKNLNNDIKDCDAKIKSIDIEFQKKKIDLDYWKGIESRIYDLSKSNHARLIGDKRGTESDEFVLLTSRLSELEEIAVQDEQSAKEKHDADVKIKTQEKKAVLDRIAAQISQQDIVLRSADFAFKTANSSLNKAQEEDKKSRNALTRFFFKSNAVNNAEKWAKETASKKQQALDALDELQKKYVDTAQEYDQQIQAIPIIRTRPTYSEKAEKEKLEKRKAYLLDSYARTRGGIAHENQD